ncbi:MAG TPA: IclR family transcriptional regulator [Vicinamibacterales bacterium]|nr:IclR family transcriptional regulator [Vicinamibacterales bacterium]
MPEISKTADQALTVLLAVSEGEPRTPAQLARDLNMNRTVVHRLLTTLHQRGFVIRQDDGFVPGTILVHIAELVQPELRARGHAAMLGLAEKINETVVMQVRDGEDAVVLDQVVADSHVVRVEHKISSRHPLGKGAGGRALLTHLDAPTFDRIAGSHEHPDVLKREIEDARRLGYALSHDELQQGVHGVAVPVLDRTDRAIASIAIIVPTSRSANLIQYTDELLSAAAGVGLRDAGSGGSG